MMCASLLSLVPPLPPIVCELADTEHHMYAAVPCYNLETLHDAIRYDLPPTPNGIVATWGVIAREMRLLRSNPLHFQRLEIPGANAGAGVNYRASSVSK